MKDLGFGLALILDICMYPFVFLMYFFLKNEATPKKNIYFGITLNKEQASVPEVAQITATYNRQMKTLFWIMMLAPIPMFFVPWFSIFMTLWLWWVLGSVVCFFVPFGLANRKLKALKAKKGWKQTENVPVFAEMKNAGQIRRVRFYQFLPPCGISLIIAGIALALNRGERMETLSILVGTFAIITFLFWAAAVWMDKQKTAIISTNSEVNINYTRAGKNLWKNFWVCCAWINTVYMASLVFALDADKGLSKIFVVATVAYVLLTAVLLVWAIKKKQKLDVRYRAYMDLQQPDADDNWIWGMFYYNPKDKHTMVEKRVGMGTTINLATLAGKVLAVFCSIWILAIPVADVWVILTEFTPIRLEIREDRLVASQIGEDYSIPVIIVEDVTLLTELPKWSKVSGTGMEELKKGTFRIPEVGKCEVFLNPTNNVFIRFEAAGTVYYMSGVDDEETMSVYEMLVE